MRFTLCLVGLVSLRSFAAAQTPASAAAAEVPPAAPATIADFAWITGRWVGASGKTRSEEIWSTAEGGVLIGMYRQLGEAGKHNVIEIEVLREVAGSVELRFRHLSDALVAWEAPEQPLTLRLIQNTPSEFVFVDDQPQAQRKFQPRRMVWRRPIPDQWEIEVHALRDGKEQRILAGLLQRTPLIPTAPAAEKK